MVTLLLATFTLSLATASSASQDQPAQKDLGGTSWRLVKIESMDDTTMKPADRAKYTMTFGADGSVTMQVDCNRGNGTWKSEGEGQIEFSPIALTRAMCEKDSLHDRIVKDLEYFRSYMLKDGHLFLSLMADGGIYELEPMPPAAAPVR